VSIGARITEERKRLGITQAAFAKQLGISLSSQKRYEKSETVPNIYYIGAMEQNGIDVAYVMTGSHTPNERLRFYSVLDRQTAELLVLYALQLDIGGFGDSVAVIAAEKGTPEFLSKVLDALIANSHPLQERLNAGKKKVATLKKRIAR
jgi:transcriptional regulator with XRE-family HTH domain